MDVARIILLVVSLIVLGFTAWWFYLAVFDKARFSRLMEERSGPRISERVQYISALVLFPLMLIGVILLVMNFMAQ